MLYLTTGTPGAGKSVWTIAAVEARRVKEGREVYYFNIKGLTLPWHALTRDEVLRWWEVCPPGALIVIDEAQDIFPKGSSTQKPPEHCDRISKHRHAGHDIYLVTQHPMKLDANVRKDVEEHRHLMRKFGTHWVTVHLWKGTRDNCDKTRKDSMQSQWKYPKEVFTWFESAEIHTVKVRVPWQVILLVLVPVFIGYVGWYVFYGRNARYDAAPGAAAPAGAPGAASKPGQPGGVTQVSTGYGSGRQRAPIDAEAYVVAYKPRIDGMPFTAPRYDELTQPVRVPVVVGCWQTASKAAGWCITQQGTRVKLSPQLMAAFIENGGAFHDFDEGPRPGENGGSRGSSTERQTGGPGGPNRPAP